MQANTFIHRLVWWGLIQNTCEQLAPARRILLDVLYRRSCRSFQIELLAEDSGDRGEEQAVEFRKVLRRQVPARFERAGRQ